MNGKRNIFARIGHFFTFFTNKVYDGVAKSPLGRLFTAYPASDRILRGSVAAHIAHPKKAGMRPFRSGVARAMDKSMIRRSAYALLGGLCRCSLRTVGAFFLTTGAYAVIITWLLHVIWQGGVMDAVLLFGGAATALVGILLLFSERSVASALTQGAVVGWLLRECLGLSDDAIKDIPRQGKPQYLIAVPLGMAVGALTALVGPLYLLLGASVLLLIFLVIANPEAGVVVLLVTAPFIGLWSDAKLLLCVWAFLCGFGYLCKLLRGTRAFHLEIQDLVVLLMLLFTLFSGVSVGGASGAIGALAAALLMSLYFPAVNMLATPHWLLRCRWALLLSATGAAIMGIFQFVYAAVLASQGTGEISMGMLGGAVRAGFSNNTAFAYFLVLTFPFALYAFVRSKSKQRLPSGFACVSIATATVLTWSQSSWLALVLEIVVICLLCERRTFPYLLLGGILLPGGIALIPKGVRQKVLSFLSEGAGISVSYTGDGGELTARILFGGGSGFFGYAGGLSRLFFGLGYGGLDAISALYIAGSDSPVMPSLNFWLYRLLEGGLAGVILPGLLFFFLLQSCFSLLQSARSVNGMVAPVSGVAMIFGVLLLSFFSYSWQDPAALVLFFAVIALFSANARYRREREYCATPAEQNDRCAELEYHFVRGEKGASQVQEEVVSDELQ